MAPNQQTKSPDRRSRKPNWLLGCFGFPPKSTPLEPNKPKKPGHGKTRRWIIRLCAPKIRVMNVIKRKKVIRLDAKAAVLKATQNIIVEASKMHQRKLSNLPHYHAFAAHHQAKWVAEGKEMVPVKEQVIEKEESKDGSSNEKQEKKSKRKQKQSSCGGNVSKDSLIGMSIMLSTLIIMGIWGKLCAILCMSAWFYCIPLLRLQHTEFNRLHLHNSEFQRRRKNKSLLQGFLHKLALETS